MQFCCGQAWQGKSGDLRLPFHGIFITDKAFTNVVKESMRKYKVIIFCIKMPITRKSKSSNKMPSLDLSNTLPKIGHMAMFACPSDHGWVGRPVSKRDRSNTGQHSLVSTTMDKRDVF